MSTDKEPVQAYVPKALIRKFKHRYRHHGAITQLIVRAFELATADDPDQTELQATREAKRHLDEWEDRAFGAVVDEDIIASILRDAAEEEDT